jgi:hypothetical protein
MEMKKLILATLIVLVAIFPSVVVAGNIYWNANATFHNDARFTKPKLPRAEGTATITCIDTGNGTHEWNVMLKFSGLLKNYSYIFQFGVQDQLRDKYDCYPVTTDKRGKIDETITITDLDSTFGNISYPPLDPGLGYVGYTILRLLDLEGESGGKLLTPDLEPNNEPPDENPYYAEHPNATMVMRARQDGIYGLLEFLAP